MKKLLLVVFLVIIAATNNARAQITLDSTSSIASNGSQSNLNWSHSVGTNNNRLLVVSFSSYNPGLQGVNSVTYKGISLAKLTSKSNGATTYTEIWYLLNPPTGTNTLSVSYNRSEAVASAISFYGVDQTTPFGAAAVAGGTSTSPSVIVSSAVGEVVINTLSSDNTKAHTITAGSGQISFWDKSTTQSHGTGSTKPGAASVTMASSLSISRTWATAAVPIKPACLVGTPTPITVAGGVEPSCQITNSTTTTTYATTATNSSGYNWSLSNASAGTINSVTGVMTWGNGFAGTVDIQVVASGCNGLSSQIVRTVNITPIGTWTGAVSTRWDTAANWTCNTIPTSSTNVTIPSGLYNYPTISSGVTGAAKNLTIETGASITVVNGTLQIGGTTTTNGGKITATSGKVEFNGNTPQVIAASLFTSNIIKDLIITNSAGVSLGGAIRATNTVGFGNVNNSTLDSKSFLTLVSNAANTASVTDITNGGANSGNKIIGDVTVERYMLSRRAFRFFTAPINSTTSIRANWMENTNNPSTSVNNNPAPGYGTHITGTGGNVNGFDATNTNNPSLYTFNNATQTWIAAPNTAGLFAAGNGLRVLIRGSRSVDLNNNAATSSMTTLRATGTLVSGPVVFAATGGTAGVPTLTNVIGAYSFIANPYASVVDWNSILASATDISETMYIFDPTITGSNGRGGYVSYNAILKVKNILSSLVSNNIQSGQAFFVQTTGRNPSLTFKENYKTNAFLPIFRTGDELPHLNIALQLPGQVGTTEVADGTAVYFSKDFTSSVSNDDSYKFTNQDENIAILRDGKTLSIEGRQSVVGADSIPLKIWQLTKSSYAFKINMENFADNVEGYLQDKFLNTLTPLAKGENSIPFTVTSDAASIATDRFKIVFETFATLPVRITNFKAYPKNKDVQIEWVAESESNIDMYEIERSADAQHYVIIGSFKAKNNPSVSASYTGTDINPYDGDNYYRIKTIEKSGETKLSEVVKVQLANAKNSISVVENPVLGNSIKLLFDNVAKGTYVANLINAAGERVYSGKITYDGGSSRQQLELANHLPVGIYQLQLGNGTFSKTIQVLMR